MSPFRLLALGVGDAFSARYYSSCLALEAEGAWLLIDCPHPIRKILREGSAALAEPLDVDHLAGVVLTHLHADHCSGLEGLGFFGYYVLQRRIPLLLHPVVQEKLWDGHLAAAMAGKTELRGGEVRSRRLDDFFDLVPLRFDGPIQFGPFAIECRLTLHSLPTTALRLRAAGRSLGYSADTAFDPTLIDWLAQADLLIHETNHGIHTPYEKLAELPAEIRKRMRLIHYPDDFNLSGSVITPLRQGECVTI
jgi:ribonuclease BN (tRNA processing enzyme)